MSAEEEGGGGVEEIEVELFEDMPTVEAGEGIADSIEVEMVVVDFGSCAVAGVEVGSGGFDEENTDVGGEKSVEREAKAGEVEGEIGVEMSGLSFCVDAGIGAPGTCEIEGVAKGSLQSVLDEALNGGFVCLNLPAAIMRAVIGDGEFIARHGMPR